MLNALVAFLVFVWIARQLPEREYANYVAAFALLEVGLVLSSFGMEWVTSIFVPQVRLKATGAALNRFVWQCAAFQVCALFVGACVLFLLASRLTATLGLEGANGAFRVYALVMLVEGGGRVFRDQLLSCLLLQGAAQISQMVRNVAMLCFSFWAFQHEHWRTAEGLAFAELAASTGSLLLAVVLLYRYLRIGRTDPAADSDWQVPRWGALLRAGRNAWLSNIANLTWSGQMVILLATHLIGAEATAQLGFARNLAEQVRKYIPMEFLLGIVRTLLIARFAADGDRQKLGLRAGLMYKANLLFLLPLVVLAIVRGGEICGLLSSGRYQTAHWLLVGWLSVLVVWAHHRLTDLLAHAVGRSGLTSKASILLMVTPLVLFAVAQLQDWVLLFLVLIVAEATYSGMVVSWLNARTVVYKPDWAGLAKFGISGGIASGALAGSGLGGGAAFLVLATGLAFVVVWAAVLLLQAWSRQEATLLPEKMRRWAMLWTRT